MQHIAKYLRQLSEVRSVIWVHAQTFFHAFVSVGYAKSVTNRDVMLVTCVDLNANVILAILLFMWTVVGSNSPYSRIFHSEAATALSRIKLLLTEYASFPVQIISCRYITFDVASN